MDKKIFDWNRDEVCLWMRGRLDLDGWMTKHSDVLQRAAKDLTFDF